MNVVPLLIGFAITYRYRLKIKYLVLYYMPASLNPAIHKINENTTNTKDFEDEMLKSASNFDYYSMLWRKIIE